MRAFAQKPKATKQTSSTKTTIPARALFGQSREVGANLHSPRTMGNQAEQRLLKGRTENLEASSASNALTGLSYDFSQIPVYTKARNRIQQKLTVSTPGDVYE